MSRSCDSWVSQVTWVSVMVQVLLVSGQQRPLALIYRVPGRVHCRGFDSPKCSNTRSQQGSVYPLSIPLSL
ncbi:Uncharacterised protein [Mycobacteroides abscessus subsp. abscessus]|nr:Uncharacterised protein [Mycobacteroides abscessus subsp. abscessus]